MARFLKSRKESIGKSPEEFRFSGEKKVDQVRLTMFSYNDNDIIETEVESIAEFKSKIIPESTTWLNIDGLHDTDILTDLSEQMNIDKYILADVLNTHNRPRFHEYDSYFFISTKLLKLDESSGIIVSENLSLIFSDTLIISFQEIIGDVFDPVRNRIRRGRKRIRNSGADYLTYALLDIVIDNYIHIISSLGEKIEDLDDELVKNLLPENLERINKYKVEINYMRKTVKPCREVILSFNKTESDMVDDEMHAFLQELRNNIEQANESVDNYREILSDQLNIFHTTVTYKQNDILKFLTIFSVIFIPITFIAGIYGTNFDFIPELSYRYSYFIMWGVILVVVITMLIYFKKRKWF